MQLAVGSSLLLLARRFLYSSSAQGWNGTSPGFRFRAMSPVRPGEGRQSPASSGLPSGVRGTGAARFGLPSGVRGMPAVGCLSHCADVEAAVAQNAAARTNTANGAAITIRRARIAILLLCDFGLSTFDLLLNFV